MKCSQCPEVKGATNHWHMCWWSGVHFHTVPVEHDPALIREVGVYVVCGDNCAHKVFQHFLEYLRNTQS